ncbi:MAG: D-alanyl-D-alanine carboxypeptidase, partial [Acidimicrobiaceae bacterium]|nr:D-alanyl-D-alanine carboxypeptidase [Acidimicrobiaceae bacterium]
STVLASRSPAEELIPASNLKLLTATAALDKLGPDFVYTTVVRADAAPVRGVLNGNLYLVGSGDPVLRTAPYVSSLPFSEPDYTSLEQLARQVVAAGVRVVTGSVVGDESFFDAERAVPTWKPVYTAEGDVGPLSALDVNDGFALSGGYYKAAPSPATAAAVQFAALLAADGVKFMRPKPTPRRRSGPTVLIRSTVNLDAGTTGPTAPPRPNPQPPPATAGITPPSAVPITAIDSPPLAKILETILSASDDTGAELVTKELGARFGGAGTTAAGIAVIRADLAARGLPVSQLQTADGSGLDRSDRVTCQLIFDDLTQQRSGSPIVAGLPVAGKTGTLGARLKSPVTAGRILAKTGTLDDVSSLSGFVLARPGAPAAPGLAGNLVFSLIIDGLPSKTGDALSDDVATALATYPDVPPASEVGPG